MGDTPFQVKRIYDTPSDDDGCRVLVDRLWPRGFSKEAAKLAEWMQKIAPSPKLRTWFDHDPGRYERFKNQYETELAEKQELVQKLLTMAESQPVTLLYAAKDQTHNHAIVLKEFWIKTLTLIKSTHKNDNFDSYGLFKLE